MVSDIFRATLVSELGLHASLLPSTEAYTYVLGFFSFIKRGPCSVANV